MASPTVVLALVAHPDDEVLGAGGTLARHASQGDDVHIVYLTDGVSARGDDRAAAERRAKAAAQASSITGARPPKFLGFSDNRLDEVALLDVVRAIEAVISAIKPMTIYTHHAGDLNIDHAICHRAVLTACRPMPQSTVRNIFAMEVASSTEWATPHAATAFVPTRYVDISSTIDVKRRAIEVFAEEMRPFPHPRSIEAITALATWRGASAGLTAAEAFMVVREVVT